MILLTGVFIVPGVGIEPTRYCYHWILSPARLPIPPSGQVNKEANILIYFFLIKIISLILFFYIFV